MYNPSMLAGQQGCLCIHSATIILLRRMATDIHAIEVYTMLLLSVLSVSDRTDGIVSHAHSVLASAASCDARSGAQRRLEADSKRRASHVTSLLCITDPRKASTARAVHQEVLGNFFSSSRPHRSRRSSTLQSDRQAASNTEISLSESRFGGAHRREIDSRCSPNVVPQKSALIHTI